MKRSLVIGVVVMFHFFCVMAQSHNCSVTGVVKDSGGEPIPYTSIALWQDGSIKTGMVTDEKGKFLLKANSGHYDLSADFIGYQKQTIQIELKSGKLDIGTITLEEAVQNLSEVTVTAKMIAKKTSVERTSINAEANTSGAKGSVIDILRTATSVSVSADNAITLRGKSNVLILLDGVPTTVNDLQSIPAANVKNVDIITNPDARFDAEGTGGIINIISNRQTGSGLSGVVGANYGFSHFVNGNFALGYNTPKVSWRMNGNAKYEDDIVDGSLFRQFVQSEKSINQQIHSAKTTSNINIGVGAMFRPDKKNTVNADVKLLLPRFNTCQDFHNTYMVSGVRSIENRYSDVTWNRENLDVTASWQHIIKPKKSEFKLGGNLSKIWGHRPSYYFLEGNEANKSKSGGSPLMTSLQGDLKFTFAPGTLETGAKMSYRRNDIYHEFYDKNGDDWIYSPQFSNDLIHQEYIPAVYALFSSKDGGKFSYKAGLRAEYSIVKLQSDKESLDSSKGDFFLSPSLSAEYKLSPSQRISLAYSSRIGRPAYPQLNPYMSMVDGKTFEQGNMNLSSEKSHNIDLAYSVQKELFSVFADLYLNHTSDYITQVSKLTQGDVLLLTYINCNSDFKTGLDFSLRVSPVKWVDATLSTNVFYTDTQGGFEDIDIDNNGWSNSSSILLNFVPHKLTSIQLQYFLLSPLYYPQFTTAQNHYMNIGMKQGLCKGALTLSATLTDVFNTDKWEIHSSNRIFTLENSSHRKSRMLWLGLTYNFNSFKQQKAVKKQELERSRLDLGL